MSDKPIDRSVVADARRFRWLLDGNGYFMEENFLCGHGSYSNEEADAARRMIDETMAERQPAGQLLFKAETTEGVSLEPVGKSEAFTPWLNKFGDGWSDGGLIAEANIELSNFPDGAQPAPAGYAGVDWAQAPIWARYWVAPCHADLVAVWARVAEVHYTNGELFVRLDCCEPAPRFGFSGPVIDSFTERPK